MCNACGYPSGMAGELVVASRLPRSLVERLDVASRDELRSRSNMVARLIDEGLRRREAADKPQEA